MAEPLRTLATAEPQMSPALLSIAVALENDARALETAAIRDLSEKPNASASSASLSRPS